MVSIEELIKKMEQFDERLGVLEQEKKRDYAEEEKAMKEHMEQLEKEQKEYLYGA